MGIPLVGALLLFFLGLGLGAPRYDARARIALFGGTIFIISLFYAFFW